jgi:alkylhydroperoxidase family enzyme
MAAVEEVEWETCCIEPGRNLELERYLRSRIGMVPSATGYFAECPWVARSIAAFWYPRGKLIHIDVDLCDKIGLVVSQDNSCRYCFAASRLLMRMAGVPEPRIRQLEEDLLAAELEPREQMALEFARRLSRSNPLLARADIDLLRDAGYPDPAIKEMAVVAAYMCAMNRFSTLPALPPQRLERLPDRPLVRLLRPLVGRLMRSRRSRGAPDVLEPELEMGPFAYLVRALEGLPLARSLRQIVDEAWQSPLLSRRQKGLVVAVIARGLGCSRSEQEAGRLLAEEGLGADEQQPILAHLASPELDPAERVIVPFARETIWYRPASIQRRVRGVQEVLSPPQLLELIGVVSLANMLCRLDIVVDCAR